MQLINRENPRKGFTFLLSFYQATENLSDEVRLECLDTVIRYGLYNEEKTDNDIAKIILAMAKSNNVAPLLDRKEKNEWQRKKLINLDGFGGFNYNLHFFLIKKYVPYGVNTEILP
ncbi:MAG: hypothetical protein HFE76_08175 [Firmicutes bacterium]|nr:hypothetical protein [Bacillota bacterium]